MKRVFITGGNGFIGKNLAEFLNSHGGYDVFAPSRGELDMVDLEAVRRYVERKDIDLIFHGANVGGSRKQEVDDAFARNLRMFFNAASCKDSVDRIIICGSGAEYDKRFPIVKAKEEDHGKRIPADDYGLSKFMMSRYAEEAEGMVVLRFFGVFGKNEDYEFKFISNAIVKNLLHMPITIRQNVNFDYLYIDDCLRVIEWFLSHKASKKAYNVASGQTVDLLELAERINQNSDFKSDISILNPGLNLEYTADISRLREEIPSLDFTPFDKSIPKLIGYYKGILEKIDKKKILEDPYIAKINARK